MAKRRGKHRTRLSVIVALLVSAVAAFCILSSLQEKDGFDFGLPALELPGLSALSELYEAIGGFVGDAGETKSSMENALEVSAPAAAPELSVHFLDVGQAKAILIQTPEKNVLIDAGENNQGRQVLRYLRAQGVQKLDIAIGTHPHSDHVGGLDTVISEMQVEAVILPELPEELVPTTQTYTDLLLAIRDKGLFITPAAPGDSYDLGGGVSLTILAPLTDYADLNNMSVVSRLDFGTVSFLFTGDASAQSELSLLESGQNLRADVLDVGHHGSDTATTREFLQKVNPRIAVISCGVDNSYGHPHRAVVERLTDQEVQILRTDLQGAVIVTADGEALRVEKEKD